MTVDVKSEDSTKISDMSKDLRTQLNAKVNGAGVGLSAGVSRQQASESSESQKRQEEYSRMTLQTQGGNGLVASRWLLPSLIRMVSIVDL